MRITIEDKVISSLMDPRSLEISVTGALFALNSAISRLTFALLNTKRTTPATERRPNSPRPVSFKWERTIFRKFMSFKKLKGLFHRLLRGVHVVHVSQILPGI